MRVSTVLFIFLASVAAVAGAQTTIQTPARIVYTFEHPQLQPSRYTITVDENGTGHFSSEPGTATIDANEDVYPAPIDREIRLEDGLRAEMFRYARSHDFFNEHCDRGRTELAFTGNRTLTYSGADGRGSCAFVWASDPVLQRIADQLNAVAFTLEVGRRLDVEVQHDRLGLDSELASLQDALKDQRASGLRNIAPELQTIAGDDQVMNRARKRAMTLLSRCDDQQKRN